ncbi:MAG: aspartyl protease [Thermosynechococcaceae cyanobacterium]
MISLVIPKFKANQMGQVIATIQVTNRIDQVMSERGFIPEAEIRSCVLDDVLVDTGVTLLGLPTPIIESLGLVRGRSTAVETTAGIQLGWIFRDVDLEILGRRGTFDCLELKNVSYALLGVVPMKMLGLEPDLQHQKLRVLPMTSEQTYLSVL